MSGDQPQGVGGDDTDDRFVARQVRFQLGRWADLALAERLAPPRAELPVGASRLYTLFAADTGRVLLAADAAGLAAARERLAQRERLDPRQRKFRRVLHWMDEIRALGGRAVHALDPQDARVSAEEHGGAPPPWPVWQFNRRPWARHAVLWPLPQYHGIDQDDFVGERDADEPPWRDKRPRAVWRGALSGTHLHEGAFENVAVTAHRLAKAGADGAQVLAALQANPRVRVVRQCMDSRWIDAGLVARQAADAAERLSAFDLLRKRPLTRARMREYRYLLCLEGNDYASALYWSLNSNSVVLRQTYDWETFADAHFAPWVHYVPVDADRADIEAKIAWCEARPGECERIIENARGVCARLARPDLRRAALATVVGRLEAAYGG